MHRANALLGSGETQFHSIVFVHFGPFKAIGSMKFFPAMEFCRKKKKTLNPEGKLACT
jgi:hypothetical protein